MTYLFLDSIDFHPKLAISPSIPKLIGILENEGIDAEHRSINYQYFKHLLSKESTNAYISYLSEILAEGKNQNSLTPEEIKFFRISIKTLKKWSVISDFCIETTKNKKFFYNRPLLEYAKKKIQSISILYKKIFEQHPEKIFSFDNSEDSLLIDIDKLQKYYNSGLFFDIENFYNNFIDELLLDEQKVPKCIGISINFQQDFLYALLLSYKIKQRANIHINIGGTFPNSYNIGNLNSLFGTFFDSISYKDSSNTVVELYKYLNNEQPIEKVSNLIYSKDGEIIKNPDFGNKPYSELPHPEFNGYNKNDYFNPEFVLPLQASNSCYWKKCIFCDQNSSAPYRIKPVDKIIEEIELLSKKYNTKIFTFWDNALSPKYLNDLSKKLIEKKLNISYSAYARFEKNFDIKLLKQMKKSGCLCVYWGIDSCSDRVLKYINKGVTTETQIKVLKASYKAGIYNYAYLILGHPTETKEEMEENIAFVKKYKKYIDSINVIDSVAFLTGSTITKDQQKYKNLINFTYEELLEYQKKINTIASLSFFNLFLASSSFITCYLRKYGINNVRITTHILFIVKKSRKIINLYIKSYALKYCIQKRLSLSDTKQLLSTI